MTNISDNLTDSATILPYQRPVFDKLCAVARASLFVDRSQFKVLKPRCNFWLIGPSGSGKTHLSKKVAQEVGVPIFSISVSDWIILGNSNGGSNNTWPLIVQFVLKNIRRQGVIIFIDELDKCDDDSSWNTYLRTEIFSLCDARVPVGVKDSESENGKFKDHEIAMVEDFLKNKAMIIGGAAFQQLWEDRNSTRLGFNPCASDEIAAPELSELASSLPRELINRFSSDLFVLPQLKKQDYHDMVHTMAEHVPSIWRKRFVSIGLNNLNKAVSDKKGARYIEETLLSALVEERAYLIESIPHKGEKHTCGLEFKNDLDEVHLF